MNSCPGLTEFMYSSWPVRFLQGLTYFKEIALSVKNQTKEGRIIYCLLQLHTESKMLGCYDI